MSRVLRGTVSSNKMDKTAVVRVERVKEHPIYRKKYTVTTKFKAHDEKNTAGIGDVVEITETRPLSKDKHWIITKVISTGERS